MQIRPWYVLIVIVVLALAAGWLVWPGQIYDPYGWRSNLAIQQGLDHGADDHEDDDRKE